MKPFFARASRRSYQVGAALCLVHLIAAWFVIIQLGFGELDAQWQLIWLFFVPFDFPFSLIAYYSGAILPDWSLPILPYPLNDFQSYILPAFIHGVVGPVWYFLIPVGISGLMRKRSECRFFEPQGRISERESAGRYRATSPTAVTRDS
jgi:hypothetical protein